MIVQLGYIKPSLSFQSRTVCLQCMRKLARSRLAQGRQFAASSFRTTSASPSRYSTTTLDREYFWANRSDGISSYASSQSIENKNLRVRFGTKVSRGNLQDGHSIAEQITKSNEVSQGLSHVARRRRKTMPIAEESVADSKAIPPDASSRLVSASAAAPPSSIRRRLALFLSLSKPRLTFLVVLTAATPYGLYPVPDLLSSAAVAVPSLSAATLLFLSTGTFLASASANTFNMLLEPQYDARMSRTRNRPLVRNLVTPYAAALYGVVTGIAGVAILYFGCNPTTSCLGAANIFLYAAIYTPMKRISTINTWVGALVGAIPPLMGWTAAAGQYSSHGDWQELLFTPQAEGGWWLAALLFAWQFPHFNALSHTIREEYANAGYKMLCSVNPARNARVALRYSILMFPISIGLFACGVVGGPALASPTTILWLGGSTAANGWMMLAATKFWWYQGARGTARGLFWASVWHLPILLVMAMALKKGMWAGLAESLGLGDPTAEEEDDFVEDLEGAASETAEATASIQSSL